MRIESSRFNNMTNYKIENTPPIKHIPDKSDYSKNDLYSFSPEALAHYNGDLNSIVERPVDPIEIKPKPP